MIEARDVAVEIAGRTLLEDVTFAVPRGTLVALVGPNGVGKTTLLRALGGLHSARAGTISIDGSPLAQLGAAERARRVTLLGAEETVTESLRVRDVVAAARYPYHRWWQWRESADDAAAIATALEEVQMTAMRDRTFASLSSGERRNVWVALALAQQTPALLLDEPTTHLDLHVAARMLGLLRRLARNGKSVLCALHDLNEAAAFADAIVLLGRGRVRAAGPPEAVLADPELDAVYEIALDRVRLPGGGLRIYPSGAGHAPER